MLSTEGGKSSEAEEKVTVIVDCLDCKHRP